MPATVSLSDRSKADDWQPLRLRAPAGHGETLAVPPLDAAGELLAVNRARVATCENVLIGSRPLSTLRQAARADLIAAARRYVARWTTSDGIDDAVDPAAIPLVLGGHQPVFFHPGVWAKNFAAARVARQSGGIAVNLIVDNDSRSSVAVGVPQGGGLATTRGSLEFDARDASRPWEEVTVGDPALFASFGDRVRETLRPYSIEPLISRLWPRVLEKVAAGESPVTALTAARNLLEREWGLRNLELPVSHLARLDGFHWFVADLLARLPDVHRLYNDTVHRYRQVNRVRNAQHPVPDLRQRGDVFEAPFWIWKRGESKRGRLLAERTAQGIALSDGERPVAVLPIPANGDLCCAVRELNALESRGWVLRPRALSLTLFARVFLADLFVHGIGGAKYDEMTDRLIRGLYGIEPPGILVVTTTVHLPLGDYPTTRADLSRVRRQLREIDYHPEQHLNAAGLREANMLIDEKRRLAAEQRASEPWRRESDRDSIERRTTNRSDRKERGRQRFRRLAEINSELARPLSGQRRELEQELQRIESELRANQVLRSREYAFALFPEWLLRPILRHVAGLDGDPGDGA